MTDKEVMQMALHAMYSAREFLATVEDHRARLQETRLHDAMREARNALSDPEQEPKPQAHMLITEQGVCGGVFRFRYDAEVAAREGNGRFSIVPLYTAPLQHKAMLTQPEQAPVAYAFKNSRGELFGLTKEREDVTNIVPLYTAPPQREWQGLTDEEVVERANADYSPEDFARGVAWAELKLKEKNA